MDIFINEEDKIKFLDKNQILKKEIKKNIIGQKLLETIEVNNKFFITNFISNELEKAKISIYDINNNYEEIFNTDKKHEGNLSLFDNRILVFPPYIYAPECFYIFVDLENNFDQRGVDCFYFEYTISSFLIHKFDENNLQCEIKNNKKKFGLLFKKKMKYFH